MGQLRQVIDMASHQFTAEDWRRVRADFRRDLILQACGAARQAGGYGQGQTQYICDTGHALLDTEIIGQVDQAAHDALCAAIPSTVDEASGLARRAADAGHGHEVTFIRAAAAFHAIKTVEAAACNDGHDLESEAAMALGALELKSLVGRPTAADPDAMAASVVEAGKAKAYRDQVTSLAQAIVSRGMAISRAEAGQAGS